MIRVIGYDDYRLYNLDKALESIRMDEAGLTRRAFKGETVSERVAKGTSQGLMELGIKVKRDAVKMAPIDTGKLRASGYVHPSGSMLKPSVTVGFTAEYSLYVHEDMEARHTTGEARFLAKSVAQNFGNAQQVMVRNIGAYIAKGSPYGVPFGSYSTTAGQEAGAVGFTSGVGEG